MIFLTVGTLFPFDRLVRAVDTAVSNGLIDDTVIAQIGGSGYIPASMQYFEKMPKGEFEQLLSNCDALISHAGMGSITMALQLKKPLLVMPRQRKFGEHVNDHQVHTAQKFEQLGHLLAVYNENQLVEKLRVLKSFTPVPRTATPEKVIHRIRHYLETQADPSTD